jgi:hypothetical protein
VATRCRRSGRHDRHAQWIHQPQESWAEAFSIAMVGGGQEKTLDYGKTVNPNSVKAFFLSLLNQ